MSDARARIIVIDDERSVCISCTKILEDDGHRVDYCLSGLEGVERALGGDYDVVLLDLKMPDLSGMEVLGRIRSERPNMSVIIITGYATIQTSIEAIKKGAFDYVPKPFTTEELSVSVANALEARRLRTENEFLRKALMKVQRTNQLIGRSKAMEEIVRQILKVAPTDFTVTIHGESGTGKELIAQALHNNSQRSEKPFVAVDISSLSPTLVESELFGHIRGAFTGATHNRPGYFTIAEGGTLFLDEISNISLELQGKLLRTLESRKIRQVGSEDEQSIDVRVVCATNRNLLQMVEAGDFREDLYYRLNVIPIDVPPLRDRPEDIPPLATHFLGEACADTGSRITGFSTEAMAVLLAYPWPGNVRELRNIIERMVATIDDTLLRPEHIPAEIRGGVADAEALLVERIPADAEELRAMKRQLKDMVYERIERSFLQQALERSGGNVTHAAQLVGMQRTNLHALMRKHGVRASSRDET